MADVLAASNAFVERLELDGGHLLHLEQPDYCATHIAAFLASS
ncbi:hypothetical protein NOVOSPHI9U_350022 [Novosphingobium sp. 9U]|nr:hypothetical protein NOVOSPHI9U_350022 [Novosphingobium sp. 9U]